MAPPGSKEKGFTLTELLVVIGVILVLFVLLDLVQPPTTKRAILKGQFIQAVNNARQIHIAAISMADDGAANSDFSLRWPGDLKPLGKIQTVQDYVNLLVNKDYLRPVNLKVFATAGVERYSPVKEDGSFEPAFEEKNSAFKIYLVKDKDLSDTVFLATKNYIYNTPLDPKAKPFGLDGFIICRKNGDVSTYKKQQVQNLKIIGQLPGGATVESAENCLNP